MGLREVQRLITIGVHIGGIHENTALCITEISQVDTGKVRYTGTPTLGEHDERGNWIPPQGMENVMATVYTVRSMEKMPFGVSYPDVATHLVKTLSDKPLQDHRIRMLVNISDVGMPTWLDMKKGILLHCQDVQLSPLLFASGEQYNRSLGRLGKSFLVSRFQSLLQSGYVKGPEIPEMKRTCDELLSYDLKNDEGSIKELATSLALSCLIDPYSERVTYSEKVF